MKRFFDSILSVPVSDPDDARRRRVLNILLLGTLGATIVGFAGIVISTATTGQLSTPETQLLVGGILVTTVGMMGIFQVNKRWSGRWAAVTYLLFLTLIFTFTDSPQELSNGRSLFIFMLPIAISSLILLPQASFLFATISSGIIAWLSFSIGQPVNLFAVIGFYMLALVSWLSARSLESALMEHPAVADDEREGFAAKGLHGELLDPIFGIRRTARMP